MSRLIVKNLPKNMTQERLQEIFGVKGHITNCNLKYTKDGVFRKFAFIGYRNDEDCSAAIKYFSKTFVDTSKIQVEPAYDLGDANRPRSWSKYSAESSNYIYKEKSKPKPDPEKNEMDSKNKLYENSEFLEFLEAHKLSGKGAKNMWSNDTIEFLKKSFDSQNKNKGTNEPSEVVFDDSGNESADDKYETMAKNNTYSPSGMHKKTTPRDPLENKMTEDPKPETQPVRYSVRMKGLTGRYHSDTIKEFFYPIKVKQVHIPRGLNHRQFGIVFAEFFNPEDVKLAMEKQGKFINGSKITLKETITGDDDDDGGGGHSYKKNAADLKIVPEDEEEEELSESGRLFVRNLPYTCTEEDLEKHFSKYGALVEVYVPLDTATNKMKGFAFITYMIPENAVRALTEMDGTSFQGRLLHIIPSRIKKDKDDTGHSKGSSFKTQSLQKQKSQAQSSHNWNSLFLGSNAVADVLTEKYGIKKTDLLDFETNDSLGVRMALGETQIVTETREFLLENGVSLDSFSQASGPRSKTVILVKNLPADCKGEEIAKVFSKYGTLGRVIFPPAGITAIIEFLSPSEAKKAFTNLAYTKEQKTEQSSEDEESDVEPDSVMFVKNLTLETKEDHLRKAFESCGPIRNVIVARKKDFKNQGQALSMGYGFVEFKRSKSAQKAIKKLQHMELNGHQIELKISNRLSMYVFGELKIVRLPKKMAGTGSHRGFAFVDFVNRREAKKAFNALCHSTHLYGRRLVLEWADTEETIEDLRRKTAEHFHDDIPKKIRKTDIVTSLTEETM
eukprot:XP_014782937.1 PREDICTED: probable RNA-binding protein 19 [Octopus bimaculoides]